MSGAGVVLLLIGFILVGISALVILVAKFRSCLVFLVGLVGLIMIIIGVIFIATEIKIEPTTSAILRKIFTI